MTITTKPWDASTTLNTTADVVAYLNAALEDGDPRLLQAALGDVARSAGMSQIAAAAGRDRASLYRALTAEASPSFATVFQTLSALGLSLRVAQPAAAAH